jgi:uncharacterized protein YndB with AHSA1/START domain
MTTALIVIGVLIVGLLVVIVSRPNNFRYERSISIAAPADKAFAQVIDFNKWAAWSPWEKMDLNTKKTYEGAPSGVGAKYHWLGNKNVGEGRMEITEVKPNELIRIRLEFIKPMAAVNTTDFTFKQDGSNVVVTQSMYGCNTFMGKAFGLVMNMDKMIGSQFAKGLADIKRIAEAK